MKVFVAREERAETRVAATPETVRKMVKAGWEVTVERGAGEASYLPDGEYADAGARLAADAAAAWGEADAVLVVRAPAAERAARMRRGALVVGLLAPHANLDLVRALADRGVDAIALELVPRISRAQSMDALSSQANIAGYKAVLLAAGALPRYFPLLMTAAGTIRPAKVVVMGAGVAGLQAVATAKRLGAQVEVSDVREAVREQVQSLGARFIDLPASEGAEDAGGYAREMGEDFLRRQREIVARHVAAADVVITTALVPGKPAPRLVTREMIEAMRPGSVIVDLAVEQGGNVELSRAGETVVHGGVRVLGPPNLAAEMPLDASTVYARNQLALLETLVRDGALSLDLDDEVVAGALLVHQGEVRHAPTAAALGKVAAG
ncbi:MAG TPA: Re/Si-specific NAD(P)(+) transhydrogenase subunit alpha [Thermoanaerobaculia bacterium]|nr:Re/Si-specific NAD(P)(+) transhydrogenase subunit alpha [Thermoanaerobaculia bacterium]